MADEETCRKLLQELSLKAQLKLKSRNVENNFLSKIVAKLQEFNFDPQLFDVIQHHTNVLKEVVKRGDENNGKTYKFNSPEECMSFCIAKLFFEKLDLISNESYPKLINNTDPIVALPIEVFSKPDDEAKSHFEENLKRTDILYVEMYNSHVMENDREFLDVRIIGKIDFHDGIENTEIVYPLNIHAYMFKNVELSRLGLNEIPLKEILKVTYMGSLNQSGNIKHFVSSNASIVGSIPEELRNSLTLGPIPVEKLPFDFKLVKFSSQYPSYAHFLRHHPHFNHSDILKELIQSIGIDPFRIYSFSEKRDALSFPPNSCVEKLKAAALLDLHDDSQKHLRIAKTCIEKSKYENAESAIEEALKCWPKNFKAYEMRGELYTKQSKYKSRSILKKAIKEFEYALHLNPNAQIAKQELSNIFLYLANRNKAKFVKSKQYATRALELNENSQATQFLQKIDKRIAMRISVRRNVNDMELDSLEKQKKKLEMCLKKELSSECVVMKIEVGHRATLKPIPSLNGHTHDCTVFVRGAEGYEIDHLIDKVTFFLHSSSPNRKRIVDKPPFSVSQTANGTFTMPIDIHFKSSEEPKKMKLTYDLYVKRGASSSNIRVEKVTFKNPSQVLREKLVKAGGKIEEESN